MNSTSSRFGTFRISQLIALVLTALPVAAQAQQSTQAQETQPYQANRPAQQSTTPSASANERNQTATPGPVTSPAGAPGVDNAHYVIGPEDVLQITVWREPTLSGSVPVRPDGMISIALIGDLKAAGLTPTALSEDITNRLKKFVQEPSVTVVVMAVNSQRVYVMGEVGHVGPVSLSSGMTPLQAIASAGGLTNFANPKHVYILRGKGAKQQRLPFNYKQALKGDDRQQIVLLPGDTIVVP